MLVRLEMVRSGSGGPYKTLKWNVCSEGKDTIRSSRPENAPWNS